MLRFSRSIFLLALMSPAACVSSPDASQSTAAVPAPVTQRPLPTEVVTGSWATPVSRSGGEALRDRDALKISIGVDQFEDSEFSRFGFYNGGGRFEHAYGGDTSGSFSYLFQGSSEAVSAIEVRARLSAESQAKGLSSETSEVTLMINGREVGEKMVMADDSVGQMYSWKIKDPVVIAQLQLRNDSSNELRFAIAADAKKRHGLCIYGRSLQANDREGQPITVSLQLNSHTGHER